MKVINAYRVGKTIQSKKEPLHTIKIKIYPERDISVPNLFVEKKKIWGTQLEEVNLEKSILEERCFSNKIKTSDITSDKTNFRTMILVLKD